LASSKSLDKYIDKLVERYSSLFTLPSGRMIILLLLGVCLLGGVLAILPLLPSINGLIVGLLLGFVIFFTYTSFDLLTSFVFMRDDPIFNLKRCSGLSLFSSSAWFAVIFLGCILSAVFKDSNIWIKGSILGFCAALILRLLVFSSSSFAGRARVFLSSFFQLVPSFFLFVYILNPVIGFSFSPSIVIFLSISVPVAILTVSLFIFLLNRVGKKMLGIPSFGLLKAFLANWLADLTEPLEASFDKLGSERDIRVSILAFGSRGKIKAVIVVPSLHPGPFKNVGSSLLPSMIQDALEKKFSCVVSVPHALYGHDFDLSSQVQNQKILSAVLEGSKFSHFESNGTQLVRTRQNEASASCQFFGDCALLTLTVAPKTTEDLPQELDFVIGEEARKRGVHEAVVVNAHNSINGSFDPDTLTDSLKEAATESLAKAFATRRVPVEVGAANVIPKEFSIEEGMGPGGINVIVVRVEDQTAAYVTVDGNNMVSGLREKILLALEKIGVNDGEILTTDTHAVTGLILTTRGYHPIGEVMDHTKLIDYIKEATMKALENLEPANVSWRTISVPGVKVIGKKQIEMLSLIADATFKRAKKLAVILFSTSGVFLTLLGAIL
jgi:putative membrane protein